MSHAEKIRPELLSFQLLCSIVLQWGWQGERESESLQHSPKETPGKEFRVELSICPELQFHLSLHPQTPDLKSSQA